MTTAGSCLSTVSTPGAPVNRPCAGQIPSKAATLITRSRTIAMHVRTVALALAFLAPALARAQGAETVRFTFGWTPGLVADVVTSGSANVSGAPAPAATEFKLCMTTSAHAEGVRVQMTAPAGGNPLVNGMDLAAASSA